MEDRNGLANSIANALLTSKLMNESYTDAAQRILDLSVDYCGKTVWQRMVGNESGEEYFVIQDMGYDGWVINKYKTYNEAKKAYDDSVKFDKELRERKYLDTTSMPMFLIKGQILEHIGEF